MNITDPIFHDEAKAAAHIFNTRIKKDRAIFDKGPTAKSQAITQFVWWISDDVVDWLSANSKVSLAVGLRPL